MKLKADDSLIHLYWHQSTTVVWNNTEYFYFSVIQTEEVGIQVYSLYIVT